jgi:hypothetical protein
LRIVLAVIASVIALAVIGFLVLRGNEQTHVQVRSGDVIESDPNRADDYGADTVRAYLTAAIECDNSALVRYGTRIDEVSGLCDTEEVEAEVARDQLDARGRALWKLTAPGNALPADLHVWVAQVGGDWFVTAASGPPQG